MASDTVTSAKPAVQHRGDPDRPAGKVLPALLLVALLAGLAYGGYRLVTFVQAAQKAEEAVETKFVLRRMTESVRLFEPVPLFGRMIDGKLFWLTLLFLVPLVNAAFLARTYLRQTPISVARWVISAVLFVPGVWALILAAQPVGRNQYLEMEGTFFWTPVLVVALALAAIYVVWMYVRDGQAVGWLWATFLGAARLAVYMILAGVFLLPALQKWEKSDAFSRVLLLLDVSGSMTLSDEVVDEGKTGLTRLDHVNGLFNRDKGAFLSRITVDKDGNAKNPVVAYLFGGKLDEEFKEFKKSGQPWTADRWNAWLRMDLKQWVLDGLSDEGKALVKASTAFDADKPGTPEWAGEWMRLGTVPEQLSADDKDKLVAKRQKLAGKVATRKSILEGTNIGDAVLTALTREASNMLAGVIVITDGESNQGSPSTFEEVRRRALSLKVPIFTIGVGEVRDQIAIRITDLQAPEMGPPDEKFMVRVEVDGEGLADKDFPVTLDIFKPGETKTPVMQLNGTGKFKAAAGLPHGHVEFVIDPNDAAFASLVTPDKDGKPGLFEGKWTFSARIPKVKGETYAGKEHISDPATVEIVKKRLRVLLFTGGPTREYQFTRRLFVNEEDHQRVDLSICLQVGVEPDKARVQDIKDQNRLLRSFPGELRVDDDPGEKPENAYYNLAKYDVIIAFDPDWMQVPRESLDKLQKWVDVQAGGLIVVGGPINSFQLARPGNFDKLKPVVDLLPVRVEDSRLEGYSLNRPTNRPWRLAFPGATNDTEYLRLDDDTKANKRDVLDSWETFFTGRDKWSPNPTETPQRGFYNYYPVKSVKPTATIVAEFTDPQALMKKDDNTTAPQPYLVTMRYGKGTVVYVSSGELWRLRLFRETFHDRFWTKLARYAASGTQTKQTRRGAINIGRQYTVGQYVRLNVPLYGADLNPLARTAEPVLKVIPPTGGGPPLTVKLLPRRDGEWSGQFEGQFQVNAPGEYKLELPVPGSSETLLSKTTVKDANLEMDRARPNFATLRNHLASGVNELRVTDALKNNLRAKLRTSVRPEPSPLAPLPQGEKNEGSASREDAKDDVPLFFNLETASVIPDYLTFNSKTQKNRGPVEDLWPSGPVMSLFGKSGMVATILMVVVGLLSIEWLTRKLLRLA